MSSASSGGGSGSSAGQQSGEREAAERQAAERQAAERQTAERQATERQTAGDRSQMQTRTAQPPARSDSRPTSARPDARPMGTGVSMTTDTGSTRIGEGVVAKIAGLAARDIPGVFSMGSAGRRVSQLRSLIPGGSEGASQGVSVEVGEREAAIDLNLVTWYGQSIVEISEAVRHNVMGQVEGMTGLRVVEVNIQIDDVHIEGPDDTQVSQPQRVQ
jgi:uncharacterized alkaline shock family protein YloU